MNKRMLTLGALFAVYLFWGGTYLGMRVAVATIPPFLMAGIRFLIAGGAVFLYALATGKERPKREHWIDAGIVGALLLCGGNGLVCWSEQMVPSSVAAVLVATVPLWMIVLAFLGTDGARPGVITVAGILLGFAGIGVLVLPTGTAGGRINPAGIVALLIGAFLWALGSLYSRKARVPASPLLTVSMQMIIGGALLLVVSGALGEWTRFQPALVTGRSLVGLAYLILFGSVVGFNAYIWLLKNADPTWVSTYAFVNPLVAVFLGWLLAGEQLTARSIWATTIIIASVVIITLDKNRERKAKAVPGSGGCRPPGR